MPANLEAVVNYATTGDHAFISGVAGKRIYIYRVWLVFAGATTLIFKDGSTAMTGAVTVASGGSIMLPYDQLPWFTLSKGNDLNLNSSSAVQMSGRIFYQQN